MHYSNLCKIVPDSNFHLRLIYVGKAEPTRVEPSTRQNSRQLLLDVTTVLEMSGSDKRASLQSYSIKLNRKNFYSTFSFWRVVNITRCAPVIYSAKDRGNWMLKNSVQFVYHN
jgi:hypothetical protein